ncbi:MAG: class I SAM-dependent methyltransferase [Candidatus Omnitrophota bacterium]
MAISRILRSFIWRIWKITFPFWQRLGLHVVPNHYNYPLPDIRGLRDDLWSRHSELPGINMNVENQIRLLSRFTYIRPEYDGLPKEKTAIPHQYYINNGTFAAVDGEISYCMIRYFKPKIFFEIGAGNSTYLAAQAIVKNQEAEGVECELIACEPYPDNILKRGFPGLSRLIPSKVQDVPLAEFNRLQENDILFIDSSHALYTGSDVQYEFLELLPRLNRGVIVHVHDIFLPAEYPRDLIMDKYCFFNEQYLLQAFLTFNDTFEILWAGRFMHLRHPEKLSVAFSSYEQNPAWPVSLWMRKMK